MTASITDITHYRRRSENPAARANSQQEETYLIQRLRCAEANLEDLLLHCAMEGLTPACIEKMVGAPLRLPIDYCIPEVVKLLYSAVNPTVALCRTQWRRAVPKALFGRFEPESDDDYYYLLSLLEDAYRDLSRAVNAVR